MVNITKSAQGIVKGVPNPETNETKVLKVLEAKDSKRCPACKAPHKCTEGYWCRKDQDFHQCSSAKCSGAQGRSGGAMWKVVNDTEDSE